MSNSNSINHFNKDKIMAELDFGYSGVQQTEQFQETNASQESKVDIQTGEEVKYDENGNLIEDINDKGGKAKEEIKEEGGGGKEGAFPHDYAEGTTLEVDGQNYKINNTGDVVDEQGNVIKPAAEVSEWIKSFEVSEEDTDKEISIEKISKALDLEIVGDDGKPIEYENTPDGIKAFVSDAIDAGKKKLQRQLLIVFILNIRLLNLW